MGKTPSIVIVGAGPAGLTCAYALSKQGIGPLVVEKNHRVGGIARTENLGGYLFDIGGHRFHTYDQQAERLWHQLLGPDLLKVSRKSRIYYDGRYFQYPLDLLNVLAGLGFGPSLAAVLSYLRNLSHRNHDRADLESWLIRRFGRRLYHIFFKEYTEKVWGRPCSNIQADWAEQRISGLSMWAAFTNAISGRGQAATLTTTFYYPCLGAGMMWEAMSRQSAPEAQLALNSEVVRLEAPKGQIKGVWLQNKGATRFLPARQVVSSMPLLGLVSRLNPAPPRAVQRAALRLSFRSFIMVGLIVDQAQVSQDQWLYIHDSSLRVGRVQNFKNWSSAMVPRPDKTSLGMEYFCSQGDELWSLDDSRLMALASRELDRLWPGMGAKVEGGLVKRVAHAYPVYHLGYQSELRVVLDYLGHIQGLQTIGRAGLHRYNNQDHSMLSGLVAAGRMAGIRQDPLGEPPLRLPKESRHESSEQGSPAAGAVAR